MSLKYHFGMKKDRKIDSFDSGLSNYVLDILREYYVKHDLINYNVLENQVVNNNYSNPRFRIFNTSCGLRRCNYAIKRFSQVITNISRDINIADGILRS